MIPETLVIVYAVILGSLVGSFTNVLIYRLQRRESVAFPPSRCPKCSHRLGVLDLVPVFSWLFLRGKCRYCQAPISGRYPVVESISAVGYGLIAYFFPPLDSGILVLGLWYLFTCLLALSFIDIDTYEIPDELSIPTIVVGLLVAAYGTGALYGLPDLPQAIAGALAGAGVLVLIDGFGSWVLRRFKEPRFPSYPMGYMQIYLAALVGAWLGVAAGVLAMLLSVVLNVASKKLIRIPDALTLGGLLLSLVLVALGVKDLASFVQGMVGAAGLAAIVVAVFWWVYSVLNPSVYDIPEDQVDPIAMGFGDVKLAAAIGAFLGWKLWLLSLGMAVVLGSVVGIIVQILTKNNKIPFGPYLALGGFVALIWGHNILDWYIDVLLP